MELGLLWIFSISIIESFLSNLGDILAKQVEIMGSDCSSLACPSGMKEIEVSLRVKRNL